LVDLPTSLLSADEGLVRNFSKAKANSTSTMPSLQQFEAGYSPAFSPAPPGVGSVVSPFRRVHKNLFLANYNSLASVLLDDGGSRMLMYLPSLARTRTS
jgi:hypothetical protein